MPSRRVYTRQTRFKPVYRQPYPRRPRPKFIATKTAVVVASSSRRRQAWMM